MNIPVELLYTEEHEWILVESDIATIGISDHAQSELGDVVFVEFPDIGDTLRAGESFGSVESVKAVSEIYTPVSGEVIEVNEILQDSPELVNEDPYGEGWMVRLQIESPGEVDGLMSAEEYRAYLEEEG